MLVDLSAAAQNQNNDSDDNQHTSDYADNRATVHYNSSFFQQNAGCAPRFEQIRATPGANMAKLPARKIVDRPAKRAFTTPPVQKAALLDLCAAALDQNNDSDDNQHTGSNPDNHGTIHIQSSFPQ